MTEQFVFNREKGTLLLPVENISFDEKLSTFAKEHGFVIKPEFHVTLLSFQIAKKIQQGVPSESRDEIFQKILLVAESLSWEIKLLPYYFVLERKIPEFVLQGCVQTPEHTRRSIIQLIELSDLFIFYQKIMELTGIDLPVPFSHITLYSWSDYDPEMTSGIGVNSKDDFEKYLKGKVTL